MKILAYLRASTDQQDASRALDAINQFATSVGHTITAHFIENVSGTTLNRPELTRLLEQADAGDVLLVEQIDRLTRLTADDWRTLKRTIEDKKIHLVSIDLPTSQLVLTSNTGLVSDILHHVNNMLLEILATTARKDYEDRRRRAAEGIAKAKAAGKFTGRKQSSETVAKCGKALGLIEKGVSKEDAAKAAGVGVATLYRFIKTNR
ncbi:recombinase family protein [Aeromonas veronii]|jgi:DNA invertase Pin-like site-specific DNA recombinase|uniref:recombinase family protein n=1 Tax=Aeromonas veronii TaxID=654 RepID=UPI00300767B5